MGALASHFSEVVAARDRAAVAGFGWPATGVAQRCAFREHRAAARILPPPEYPAGGVPKRLAPLAAKPYEEDPMPHDPSQHGAFAPLDPIVAVFDTKTMALRTVAELRAAEFDDIWLGVVRGESDDGETMVSLDGTSEILLSRALVARGSVDTEARRFDGILPPGSAVMSLRARTKLDDAIAIIEVTGGHVEHR